MRRLEIAGITDQPHEAFVKQMARNLSDAVDGFLLKHRHVITDRDPLFCQSFREMLKASGVRPLRLLTPARYRAAQAASAAPLTSIVPRSSRKASGV